MKQKPSGMIESDASEGVTPFAAFSCGLGIGGPWKRVPKGREIGPCNSRNESNDLAWHLSMF